MKPSRILLFTTIIVCGWFITGVTAKNRAGNFFHWLKNIQAEARSAGISQKTLEAAFSNIQGPMPEVMTRDQSQPEFTQSLVEYVAARVTNERIATGRKMMQRYPTWLGRVERKYGVQRRFIVALWGIESHYGEHTGRFPVIQSLVTLAYDGRRSNYFRKELLSALHILDNGTLSFEEMKGSWAGAMGQCQFMPSSFRRYGIDADGDRRIDIWNSIPDVFASTANYLAQAGWKDDQTWGRPVRLPDNFDYSRAGLETRLPLSRWQGLGIRRMNGRSLPKRRGLTGSLISPDGPDGPAYLVYDNFRNLLTWNRSMAFAVAVGTLADRISSR